eukprot:11197216-Lingulodinium_polyedra.AAC.1
MSGVGAGGAGGPEPSQQSSGKGLLSPLPRRLLRPREGRGWRGCEGRGVLAPFQGTISSCDNGPASVLDEEGSRNSS